ncbi:MAG: ABC transporter ATP-binding protein [Ignavibacteriae bacterium]|nr:ABC transporter ATP-binding protein [Ignavibacteriota bacterium]NOG99662.1 ABC transporter ATP-binding protein [Ignavibacteriota bacterium]
MINAIQLSDVNLSIGNTSILEKINLTVQQNDFIGIIGPNGGGKTSLLKIILGLLPPTSGRVLVFGKSASHNSSSVGYVPQQSEFTKDFPISVWDVVMMGRVGEKKIFSRTSKDDKQIVDEAIEMVSMSEFKSKTIGHLSGGQKQRVLIARALAMKPKILLLDEPTASVDTKTGQNVYELLNKLNETTTIILVSHDMSAISRYVRKIACLNKTLVYHDSKEITKEMLEDTYQCPVDLIAHGLPHRVLDEHGD